MRIGWRRIRLVLLIQLIGPRKFCFGDIHLKRIGKGKSVNYRKQKYRRERECEKGLA